MKIFSLLLSLVSVLSLSSCMELSSLITVNKDGSGTIEETVLLGAQLKALLSSMPPPAEGTKPDASNPIAAISSIVPNQKQAEGNAKRYGESVTVKSVEEVTLPDGRGGSKVTYNFTDINKVTYQPTNLKAEEIAPEAKQEPIRFGFSAGELTINIPQGNTDVVDTLSPEQLKKAEEFGASEMAMVKSMFAGMRLSFAVKASSGIASTDAVHQDGDTVTIMDIQVEKLFDNPETFKKFAVLLDGQSEPDPKKLVGLFKGVEGIKGEDKSQVKIKMK